MVFPPFQKDAAGLTDNSPTHRPIGTAVFPSTVPGFLSMRDALSVTSMGQASAALSAAASQHLTAVSGSHSLTETVLLGALTLLGLIGTEHCMTPPLNKIGVQRSAETLLPKKQQMWQRMTRYSCLITKGQVR